MSYLTSFSGDPKDEEVKKRPQSKPHNNFRLKVPLHNSVPLSTCCILAWVGCTCQTYSCKWGLRKAFTGVYSLAGAAPRTEGSVSTALLRSSKLGREERMRAVCGRSNENQPVASFCWAAWFFFFHKASSSWEQKTSWAVTCGVESARNPSCKTLHFFLQARKGKSALEVGSKFLSSQESDN